MLLDFLGVDETEDGEQEHHEEEEPLPVDFEVHRALVDNEGADAGMQGYEDHDGDADDGDEDVTVLKMLVHIPQVTVQQETKLVGDRFSLALVLAVDLALRLLFVHRQPHHHAVVVVLLGDQGRAASIQGELLIDPIEILNEGLRRLVGLDHYLDVWPG